MTESATPDVKRRRLSAADGDSQGIAHLTDLPSGVLAHTASFLVDTARALFAIALDENSATTSSPNERSSVIIGNQWDTLDFGDIEEKLAASLTDYDVEKVLLCIDAVNKLKKLKLTNCTNITGTCLEPLRGSLVIEQIDLSIIGNESPNLDPAPPISCEHVLPILDSIIEREDCALMHLHFPSVWRREASTDSDFHTFIGRYNEMRRNRGTVNCFKCNESLPRNGDGKWIITPTEERRNHHYGLLLHTCYGCLKHYCYGCYVNSDAEEIMLDECETCRRDYCKGCLEMTNCSHCQNYICNDCYKRECVKCKGDFCLKCVQEGESVLKCNFCDNYYCNSCCILHGVDDEVVDIHTCSRCDVKFKCCYDCQLIIQRYLPGRRDCPECMERIPVRV